MWQGGESAEIDARARSNDTDFHLSGRLDGGKLEATLETAGEKIPFHFELGKQLFLDSGLGAALRLPTCEEGEMLRFDSFDPISMSSTPARLECPGRRDAPPGRRDDRGAQADGALRRARLARLGRRRRQRAARRDPFGFVLEKISAQEALAPLDTEAAARSRARPRARAGSASPRSSPRA